MKRLQTLPWQPVLPFIAYFNETGHSVSDQNVREFDCRAIA
jgi:hypothetical protein